jgi:streptogramin lyase
MPEVGTQFAGYRIDGVLGRGGMGVVYLANELALDRPVALKLIAPELADDSSFRERFLRESRLAASIDHPGILPVYAVGDAGGELYLAMRFVDGTDLGVVLEDGPLQPEHALALLGQVADALDAAHARGLVHRDVKPGNVLVDGADHCYLSDFGLTTQLSAGTTATPGRLTGSLDYLAPEQVRLEDVDGRADQYALGCVLYEVLTGHPAFRRETEAQTLWAHMQEDPPPAAEFPQLDTVLARALAKAPEDRYETCNALVDEARAAFGLQPSTVAVRRWRRRLGRRFIATGAVLLALAVGGAIFLLTHDSDAAPLAPANSAGVVDAAKQALVRAVPVGKAPTEVAASSSWVWVLNSNDGAGTISKLDAKSYAKASTFSVPGTPRNLVAAFNALWVGTLEGRVLEIDPETDLVERTWTLPNAGATLLFEDDRGAGWLAVGPDAIWAGSARAISRIDPKDSQLRHRQIDVWGPMAYGFGSLWIVGQNVVQVSALTMKRVATVPDTTSYSDITTGFGSVWLADDEGNAVVRVDPRRRTVTKRYRLSGSAFGVAAGMGAVWATSDDGNLARIDPQRGDVGEIRIGGAPRSVDVDRNDVWVSVD